MTQTVAPLVHLMSDDLLDACGTAPGGEGLQLAPFTTPDAITCPACRPLIDQDRQATVDADHAAALEVGRPSEAVTFDPTVFAVLITGRGISEPILTLHARRERAVENLRGLAQTLLSDLLEFVPVGVQGEASERQVIDTLHSYGIAATIGEERVTL